MQPRPIRRRSGVARGIFPPIRADRPPTFLQRRNLNHIFRPAGPLLKQQLDRLATEIVQDALGDHDVQRFGRTRTRRLAFARGNRLGCEFAAGEFHRRQFKGRVAHPLELLADERAGERVFLRRFERARPTCAGFVSLVVAEEHLDRPA
jgi:hypothetical protein